MKYILKHIRVFFAFVRISWKTSIEYMNDFVVLFIDFIVSTVIGILFWKFILIDYTELGGWNIQKLVLLSIFGNSAWAISELFTGSWQLSEKITLGKMDKYLCKPVNTIFALIIEDMQLDEVLKGIVSLTVLLVWYKFYFNSFTSALCLFFSIISLLLGIVIVTLIRSLFSCLAFWIENTNGVNFLVHMEDFELERYPLEIFNMYGKILLLSVIPVGFIAYIPALFFLDLVQNNIILFLIEILIIILLTILLNVIWKKGVNRYEATGG